ncbi:uncharacterized protein N7459_007205 [Penicillium hispanicum]|uniref:uncharacterized protein n=1 Tax=Penicillium hispanicum TaxID=1080232 RepID=UPI0025425BAF|nr:uncharacterized protein N7459_007205 [Penicillium hispanicum]KAJ5578241.1 hypothetical protein N7459_007205 [Penicillium hispanicum]
MEPGIPERTPRPGDNEPSHTSAFVKRRKIRKGTTSCWECKHRKKRCEFESGSTTTCIFCERNGLSCVSQEFTETSTNCYANVEQRIDQVEALVKQLVQHRKKRSCGRDDSDIAPDRPSSIVTSDSCATSFNLGAVNHERLSRGRSLTGYLYSILPHPAIAVAILSSSKLFSSPLQIFQKKPPDLSIIAEKPTWTGDLPMTAHPVLFARKLIQLALCLKQFDSKSSGQLRLTLGESVDDASRRYFDAACHFVMSQDYLVGSLDGLETLILQSRYYITIGDLRTAWRINSRAVNISNLIGLPRLAEATGGQAESVLFQLAYTDRFLSLLLGLPSAIADHPCASTDHPQVDAPTQRVERIHVLVAGRIIARNLRMQCGGSTQANEGSFYDDHQETQSIDSQLKKATRLLPTRWWYVPSLDGGASDSEAFENTPKYLLQFHQYYLLVLLHQPYLIQLLQRDIETEKPENSSIDYTYSKLAAVSASREVASRYLQLRTYRRSPSYRATDGKGFIAAITLLFAHLDGHRLGSVNVLEHQRSHDLGILEKVIDLMDEISTSDQDPEGMARSRILRRLVEIEADAAEGSFYRTRKAEPAGVTDKGEMPNGDLELEIPVPYFGIFRISPLHRQETLNTGNEETYLAYVSDIVPEMPTVVLGTESSAKMLSIEEASTKELDTEWFDTWIQEGSCVGET